MKPQFLIILILTISTQSLFANIITIKQDGTGDYETIQDGIGASVIGDTVLAWPGTYYENINFLGNNITVASLYITTQDDIYIHNTVIDGNQNGSCVIIAGGDEDLTLCGFTIQNGSGFTDDKKGGGIYIQNASPKIMNCNITNNTAWYGGGIYMKFSNAYLSGNHITYNSAQAGGGIILVQDAHIEFDPVNRNNIYLNHSAFGADIKKGSYSPPLDIIVDTFTVFNPDFYFAASNDNIGFPLNDITFDILNAKISPVDADLYVSPDGDNTNSGLSPDEPLKTIWYAYKKIYPDSLDPNSIYLLPGTYSLSSNGEYFTMAARSYVSIIGSGIENTILDAENNSFHIRSLNLTRNFTISNLCFKNGIELDSSPIFGSVYINYNSNVQFQDIEIKDCTGTAFISSKSFSTQLLSSKFSNNLGQGISMGNGMVPLKWFLVKNCIVEKTGPFFATDVVEGGIGIGIGGAFTEITLEGQIINTQITENRAIFDPLWGSGQCAALSNSRQAKLDLINCTIGNNVVKEDAGANAVRVDQGSELNIYNSILYGDSIYELSMGFSSGSDFSATANISYSDLEGGETAIQNWYNQHTVNWLEGNIDADPLWDTASTTPYALPWNSPCVDAGTPMYEFGMEPPFIIQEDTVFSLVTLEYADTIPLPATDLAGNPRIVNGRIDMGAYEFQDTATQIAKQYLQDIRRTEINVWPNPFTYNAFISFSITQKSDIKVIVYDMQGRVIRKLLDAMVSNGKFSLTWNATDDNGNEVKNGAYLLTLYIDDTQVASKKVVKKGK